MRRVPAIGSPEAEWRASEKRACANARQGLQPGVPSCTGPGQPNEICVFPASWPLAVIVGGGRRFESVRGLCKSAAKRRFFVQSDLLFVAPAVGMEPFMELSRSRGARF